MTKNKITQPACNHCAPLQKVTAIQTPEDVRKAIREAHRYLAEGVLKDRQHEGYEKSNFLADVKPEGPWADVLAGDFHCTFCGRSFDLRAETYHGGGGTWGPTTAA
ncbi:MAG: hypothetical protein JWO89_897 [Verrucomicrobiaceae bacterium]|nr:hypothetical protein [Verrucomicrobiaceae bacterium]MDB6116714.1 hypothetical protein [Verrucomicrobiaceae bacterium]